jgi:hypothetical protein
MRRIGNIDIIRISINPTIILRARPDLKLPGVVIQHHRDDRRIRRVISLRYPEILPRWDRNAVRIEIKAETIASLGSRCIILHIDRHRIIDQRRHAIAADQRRPRRHRQIPAIRYTG